VEYVSTRGTAPPVRFSDALLAGLAPDGGLYVPRQWPKLSRQDIAGIAGRAYEEVAAGIIQRFVGDDLSPSEVTLMCREAYASFRHPAVAPLIQLAPGHFLLELFHGPTLAFKDVAMQLLARLMDHVLAARGERATIVGATSGDTGGAAIEAFRGRAHIDVVILYPDGRVSAVQRRQMTTSNDANVHALAVAGSFDDCQAIVKALFNDEKFRRKVRLSGVNSINWARIMAQTVYYFVAAAALGAPHRKVSFAVPTGNFGDIFAGYAAKRMGLPVDRLVIATNLNDILARTLESGRYELQGVTATQSPSMDIQVSSNFERLLFEALGRDSGGVNKAMAQLGEKGSFKVAADALRRIRREFQAGRADEEQTRATIARLHAAAGYVADPHSAVGVAVAERFVDPATPMVTLATAHPAKFPDAVEQATGLRPALPDMLSDLMERKEHFHRLPNDAAAVKNFVLSHSRAVMAEA
jgi:threonine synthase